jgi:hypothetical protein
MNGPSDQKAAVLRLNCRGPKRYRALISVPITADSDRDAVEQAVAYAHSLLHPDAQVVAGHLELVGEAGDALMQIVRVIDEDPLFTTQLPPDWRP